MNYPLSLRLLIILLSIVSIYSCNNCTSTDEAGTTLFDGKYARGYVFAEPIGNTLGLLEMHDGENHEESYVALFSKNDVQDPIKGASYYVQVVNYNGIPKVVKAKATLEQGDVLYPGVPVTNINYHSFSNHGNIAGWHKLAHVQPAGLYLSGSNYRLKLLSSTGEELDAIVPMNLMGMATTLSNDVGRKVYYYIDLGTDTYVELDSVHRHGDMIYE